MILKKDNVERIITDEVLCAQLISQGYIKIVDDTKEDEKLLEEMTVEELQKYAEENGIDIGKATTQKGLIEKIQSTLLEE